MSIAETKEEMSPLSNECLEDLPLEELANLANAAADEAERFAGQTVEFAVRCGFSLVAAKSKLKPGEWLKWLENHFHGSRWQAARYMRLASKCGARAPHGKKIESIREGLRLIAGPKDGSKEAKEEQAVDVMREGISQKEASKISGINKNRVNELFRERVIPELLDFDWRHEVKKHVVMEMGIAKMLRYVRAEQIHAGEKGTVAAYAAKIFQLTISQIQTAIRIYANGCPALISRAEKGEIAMSKAAALSRLPMEQQQGELHTLDRKKTIDAIDDLRSRISHMRDQEMGWVRVHGKNTNVFRKIRDDADASQLAELISNLQMVEDWARTIRTELGGKSCSRQTNAPKAFSDTMESSSNTSTVLDTQN